MIRKKCWTMQIKLTAVVCIIVTLAFSLCAYISWLNFNYNKREDAQKYLDTVVKNVRDGLLGLFSDIDYISTMPYYFHVVDIASKYVQEQPSYFRYEERLEVSRLLLYVAGMKDSITSVYMPLHSGRLFNMSHQSDRDWWTWAEMPWLTQCDSSGALTLIPAHQVHPFRDGIQAISFARVIKDPATQKDIAYFVVDFDVRKFNMCVPYTSLYGEQIYVVDAEGNIIFPYPSPDDPQRWRRDFYELDRTKRLVSSLSTGIQGISIIGMLPEKQYTDKSDQLLRTILLTYIVTLSGTIGLIYLMTRTFTRPLHALHDAMLQLTHRDFSIRVETKGHDEIAELAMGFNWMTEEIEKLLEETRSTGAKEKRILYYLLQKQIGPHFIYNSLETMSSMALLSGQLELADGIVALSRLMRHMSMNDEDTVYLVEELRFVEDYVYIQTMTSGTKVDLVLDVDLSHEYLLVPKFILQPLIENVYRHNGQMVRLRIRIASELMQGRLRLVIEDNGKGIQPNRLLQIQTRIEEDGDEAGENGRKHGYALHNIHMRIRLMYGADYGLKFPEQLQGGFRLYVDLPAAWSEEEA